MKSYFRFAGVFAWLCAAQAHESWAPHVHTLDQQHSDLFVLCAAGFVAVIAGLALFRLLDKRRHLKSAVIPSRGSPNCST